MDSGFVVQVTSQPGPIGPVTVLRTEAGFLLKGRSLTGFVKPMALTPETVREIQPLTSLRTILLYEGHVDNRASLAAALSERRLMAASDGNVLVTAADAWGARLQQHVVGDYGFVALNKDDSTIIAGRDALGVRRVYYHAAEDCLTVASSLRLLLAALHSTPSLDPDGMIEFVRCGDLAARRTVFADVQIIPPGHSIVWRSGVVRLVDAWVPDIGPEFSDHLVTELEEELRRLLREGVAAAARCCGRVCIELSGGLDSSTVACIASSLWRDRSDGGEAPLTLSFIRSCSPLSEEAECRQAVLRLCGLRNHTIDLEPFGAFSPFLGEVPCEPMFQLADPAKVQRIRDVRKELGLGTCLTGQGGDEVFMAHMGQPYFLRDWLRQLRWGRWLDGVRSYIRTGRSNLMELCRLSVTSGFTDRILPPQWLKVGNRELTLDHYYAGLMPASVGWPYHAQAMQLAIIRSAALGLSRPYQCDERHPLLYRPLVEFMLRVPWGLKISADSVRGLQRRAMIGILPEAVRVRVTKGEPDHNVLRDFSRNWLSIKSLAEGRLLAQHSVVEPDVFYRACERMSHGQVPKHESFLDLWKALALERWLQLEGPAQGDVGRRQYRYLWTSARAELGQAGAETKVPYRLLGEYGVGGADPRDPARRMLGVVRKEERL